MASYADLTDSFKKALKVAYDLRLCFISVTNGSNSVDNFLLNSESLREDTPDYTEITQGAVVDGLRTMRETYADLPAQGRAIVDPTLVEIGKLIGSKSIVSDEINDTEQFWIDWRDYQENTADEKVTARAVTFAADPADSTAGAFRRLTVDHNDQKIEGGRFNNTVTADMDSKGGAFQATYVLNNGEGFVDGLDYLAGNGANIGELAPVSRNQQGGLVQNPMLLGSASTDGDDQTINNWTETTVAGTPIIKVDTANVFQEGLLTTLYSTSFSGATLASSVKLSQRLSSDILANKYTPVLPVIAIQLKGSWTGDITITWGGKTQAYTELDLTLNDFVFLFPDRDKDLYPVNFDAADAEFAVTIASDAGLSATDEVVIGMADIIPLTNIGGIWYGAAMDDVEPDMSDSVSWADTATAVGKIQDTLAFLYQDQTAKGWLNTTGTNTLADF